jgi:hypothetical protein
MFQERDHVEDLRIERRIILKYIVNERWGLGNSFMWLGVGTCGLVLSAE